MLKLFVALFTLVPMIFMGVGGWMAWSQHEKITTFEPVSATILSSSVKVVHGTDSKGRSTTSYVPAVRYEYRVDGRTYTSEEVTPLGQSSTRGWANSVVDRFPSGVQTQAYRNPSDPSDVFLLKEYSFFPYAFTLFPVVFMSVGVGVGIGTAVWRRKAEPMPASGGWFELLPTTRLADRRKAALIVGTVWHVWGVIAWGHYFRVAESPYGLAAWICTIVYVAMGLVPVGMVLYYLRLGRILRDAYVLIDAQRIAVGDEITVHVEQDIYDTVQIDALEVGPVCEETVRTRTGRKTTVTSNVCYEDRVPLLQDQPMRGGETATVEHTYRVPDEAAPSSPLGYRGYPRYKWWIAVTTKIPGQPDYRAKFPLTVHPRTDA